MSDRRNEVEIVSDTLAVLYDRTYLRGDPGPVLSMFGLVDADLTAAFARLHIRRRRPARTAGREDFKPEYSTARTKEESNRKSQAASRGRTEEKQSTRRRTRNGRNEVRCSGGRVHAPHWATETEFSPRSDRPGHLRAMCDTAAKEMQRQRTVAAQAIPFLNNLGVLIDVDEDSVVVGLKCATCSAQFVPGDKVKMHGSPHHEACLQDAIG